MKYPIGIISFNRPQYLAELLKSLAEQAGDALDDREIHLFQDGGTVGQRQYANQDDIEQCIAMFKSAFPSGFVHVSEENIGHIRNVLRMEEFFFTGEEPRPAAMFLEDDIVLSPHYVAAMDKLIRHSLDVGDISYVRCIHSGRYSIEDQRLNRHKTFLPPTGQMWAYGITREYWLKERAALDTFYGMALTHPYRELDHNVSQLQWWKLGAPIVFHELDYGKVRASIHLGYSQLSTYCVMARYIGMQGVHFNAGIYEQQGWHLLQMFNEALESFEFPSTEEKRAAITVLRETDIAEQHIKLNLGNEGESTPTPGWLNLNRKYGFDFANTQLQQFSENSVEVVYSSHVLQRFQPQQSLALLRDVHRVLKPAGTVRISGLSLNMMTEQMLRGESRMEQFLDSFWPERERSQNARTHYLRLLGNHSDLCCSPSEYGQVTPLDFHQVAYMLIAAGFEPTRIRRCQFRSSSLPELREGPFDSRPNHSYFVEAVK